MNEQVASLYATIGVKIESALRGLREFRTRLGQSQSGLKTLRDQSKITATALNLGITAGLTALGSKALAAFGDAQQAMSVFQLVTHATAGEMADAAAAIEAVARDLTLPGITKKDAAEALAALGNAGLSAKDAIAGLRPTLLLAEAGEIGAAKAADILSAALLAFHLPGTDAARVVDLLAGVALAAQGSVSDVGEALRVVGPVAAAMKVPIEDVATLIGLLAKNGITGSYAGDQLKSMLLRLANPTEEASGLMASLGVHVYDAQGKMKDFREIIKEFQAGLAPLTEAQRNQRLATIFGSEAVTAAAIIFQGEGVPGFDAMKEAATKSGTAQELATAKTQGLTGATDGLAKALDTAATDAVAPFTEEIAKLERAAASLLLGFATLDPGVKAMVVSVAAAVLAFGALSLAVAGISAAVAVVGAPVAAIVAAIWGVYWAGYWSEKAILALNDAFATLTGKRIDFGQILQGIPILREVMTIWRSLQDLGLAPRAAAPTGVTNAPGGRDDWNQPGGLSSGNWGGAVQTAQAATVQFNGPVYGFTDLKDVIVRAVDEAKREGRV